MSFYGYLMLPPEVRMYIVDEMDIITRCRFACASKLCNREAKASRNYIHSLALDIWTELCVSITVLHCENDNNNNQDRCGYVLHFEEQEDDKYIKCSRLESYQDVLWETKLEHSVDIFYFATQHFKNLLTFYQNQLKKLEINNMASMVFNFNVHSVKNIKEFILHNTCELENFHALSKIRAPLNYLEISGTQNNELLATCHQVYQVRTHMAIPGLKLTFEQFMELAAKTVHIHIGALSEENIASIVEACLTGRIGKNVKSFSWECAGSAFNISKLLNRFSSSYSTCLKNRVSFQHPTEGRKIAELCYYEDSEALEFRMV